MRIMGLCKSLWQSIDIGRLRVVSERRICLAKNKERKSTVEVVYDLCAPVAERMKFEIWDIRFEKEGASWFLRVFIDKEGGITIDDCEAFSRTIDTLLDEADPVEQSYYLEVSSPGLDRELIKPEHFARYMGSLVDVRTIRPVDGMRDFTGTLIGYQDGQAFVKLEDGGPYAFKKAETAFIRLNIDDIDTDIDFGGIDDNE